jgi:hypothetical protein
MYNNFMFGPVNPQAFSGIQQQSPEQPMSPDQMNVYLMNKVDEIKRRMSGDNSATTNVINAMRGASYGQS